VKPVIVVSGGGTLPLSVRARLPEGAPVIAADGGVDQAHALGLRVDLVVGDLDSVTPEGLAAAEAAGARVERHPEDKDATDLALAIEAAARIGDEIVVIGTDGGRLDHLLAGLLALADLAHAGRQVRALVGPATIHVVHGPGEIGIDAPAGSLLTILPVGGGADGVTTTGLRFPLTGEPLPAGTTRGVSNVVDGPVTVGVGSGTLLVVLPGEAE
jgi:thiamine pyrophosphokinase